MSRLTVDLKPGEDVVIDAQVSVQLLSKSGGFARLLIVAPRSIKIAHNRGARAPDDRAKHGSLPT